MSAQRSPDPSGESATTTFSIVRHGQTDWNLHHRIQGSTDIPLNATGRAEAAAAAERLQSRRWDAIVSSPLLRASESAHIIAAELGLSEPLIVPALTERHHGAIEGLTFAERQHRFPDGVVVPGLETRRDVVDRVLAALATLAAGRAGQRVLVLSHGGIIGTLLRHVTEGERPRHGEFIANGSVHDFRWQNDQLLLTHFDATTRSPGDRGETAASPVL
ncbi:histidine phosphatase family protein [Cryobacterium sp. TMT1-2-2]|uniref:histidine phosphatase family protein n=1 Tax=Cryobacterium sp. TMT1-2-2 TaxID=1259233 RepID=UPI001068D455|nr:histidine phosphatase family protein [Cryobacterium sp. TMT1-2-2]TFD15097.1 histidine phosphatase family protein [Cryobacterium sp. TMT1-2-2]